MILVVLTIYWNKMTSLIHTAVFQAHDTCFPHRTARPRTETSQALVSQMKRRRMGLPKVTQRETGEVNENFEALGVPRTLCCAMRFFNK